MAISYRCWTRFLSAVRDSFGSLSVRRYARPYPHIAFQASPDRRLHEPPCARGFSRLPRIPVARVLWPNSLLQRLPTIWKSHHAGRHGCYQLSEKINRGFACRSIKKAMITVMLPLNPSLKLEADPAQGNWQDFGVGHTQPGQRKIRRCISLCHC